MQPKSAGVFDFNSFRSYQQASDARGLQIFCAGLPLRQTEIAFFGGSPRIAELDL